MTESDKKYPSGLGLKGLYDNIGIGLQFQGIWIQQKIVYANGCDAGLIASDNNIFTKNHYFLERIINFSQGRFFLPDLFLSRHAIGRLDVIFPAS